MSTYINSFFTFLALSYSYMHCFWPNGIFLNAKFRKLFQWSHAFSINAKARTPSLLHSDKGSIPPNHWPCNNVVITSKPYHSDIITSKWCRLDVITTSLLRNALSRAAFNRTRLTATLLQFQVNCPRSAMTEWHKHKRPNTILTPSINWLTLSVICM